MTIYNIDSCSLTIYYACILNLVLMELYKSW